MSVNFTAADRVGGIGGYIGGISALLGGMGGLFNNGGNCGCSENTPVTRYELELIQKIMNKDSELALVKSEQNTEVKIADVYDRLVTKINANKDEQAAVNREQAVYNGVNTATLQCMQNQVAQLMGLTKLVVTNSSVCPGWGTVTVTPSSSGTTVS